MSTYRVPAIEGFVFSPVSLILSARLMRDGEPVEGITPKIDGMSVSCRSPFLMPGDMLEIEASVSEMKGAVDEEEPPEKSAPAPKKRSTRSSKK